jgi:hypothetical protein
VRIARGIFACHPAFVRGLVKEREIDRRVARDEDVAVTGAHRQVIISGDAMGIERERGVFQSEIVDIGPSACGREEIIEPLLAPR